jgi:hypothetical protein
LTTLPSQQFQPHKKAPIVSAKKPNSPNPTQQAKGK